VFETRPTTGGQHGEGLPGTPRQQRPVWSQRGTGIVGLFFAVCLAAIALERWAQRPLLSPESAERLGLMLDSMSLGVGLLTVAVLAIRGGTAPGPINMVAVCVVGIVTALVLPIDIAYGAIAPTDAVALAAASRLLLLGLIVLTVLRWSSRLAWSVSLAVATLVACSLIVLVGVFGIVRLAPTLAAYAQLVFFGASIALLAAALVLGALSLRSGQRRGVVLAIALIGLAVADAHVSTFADGSLSTTAGKATRLVVLAAVFLAAVLELFDTVMSERDRAVRAHAESERAADRLVAEMSYHERFVHDARNALLAIQGGVYSMANGDIDLRMADAVSSEVDRLRDMLEEDDDPLPVTFDLVRALQPMIDCYRASYPSLGMKADGTVLARGRPSIATEVAQNLIENAIRHGGGEIVVWIFRCGDEVEVRVADRGDGVAEADRDRVFKHGETGSSGSGVGLHISRRLIEGQGGKMWFADREGGGAIFGFRLPAGRPSQLALEPQ